MICTDDLCSKLECNPNLAYNDHVFKLWVLKLLCSLNASNTPSPVLHTYVTCSDTGYINVLDFHSPVDGSVLFTIYKDMNGNIITPTLVPCNNDCC